MKILRKYKLYDLVYAISEISREMFIDFKFMKIYNRNPTMVSVWDMIGLSYIGICKCSESEKKSLKNNNDVLSILKKYVKYKRKKYLKELNKNKENISNLNLITYISFGHAQEQLPHQSRYLMIEDSTRNFELLNILRNNSKNIDVDNIMQETFGMNFEEFIYNFSGLLFIATLSSDITDINIDSIIKNNKNISYEKLFKIREYYSASYEDFRKSKLGKQYLKLKPIVKTSDNRYIVINTYLLYEKLIDGAYWVIRDYYEKRGKQTFVNEFGKIYEIYLENLFDRYLKEYKYEKLEESMEEKRCDWKVKTNKYTILIEQKSSLININTKDLYTDIKTIEKYLLEKLSKAFIQLDSTEKQISSDKIVIKLALVYENLYIPEVLECKIKEILNSEDKEIKNEYNNTFLIETREIERLMYILSTDENLFNKIIERKLEADEMPQGEKRSFLTIMEEFGVAQFNNYLDEKKNPIDLVLASYEN